MKKLLFCFLVYSTCCFSSEEIPAFYPSEVSHSVPTAETTQIDLKQVFSNAPTIYSLLLFLSASSVMLCLYMLLTSRRSELMPKRELEAIHHALENNNFELARELCVKKPSVFSKMIIGGLQSRSMGRQVTIDAMKATGKRHTISFWQKIALLNDIAIIAPMLGLLGTVTGMFYAFYDLNRSMESISSLFDGLGISVGTTVAGLIVAILAMIFYTFLKYRLIRLMTSLEHEIVDCAHRLCDGSNT